jgi:phosphate transport system permease protein
MSDLVELEEPVPEATHDTREEIRRISDRVRARRQTTSRIMVALCGIALVIAAVPLVALMYQLFDKGLSQINWKFFTTLPTTPTLIAPNATGGISNAIIGTIALTIYASILAIPIGVLVGIYLA